MRFPQTCSAERIETAFHEAGHAVISRVLAMDIERVAIVPSRRSEGNVSFRSANRFPLGVAIRTDLKWRELKQARSLAGVRAWAPSDRALHADIISTLAGAVAVRECLGKPATGCGSDNYHVTELLKHLSPSRNRMRITGRHYANAYRRYVRNLTPGFPPMPRWEFDFQELKRLVAHERTRRRLRLREMTQMLVRRHRSAITRVADRLLVVGTLHQEQIDKLMKPRMEH
jgi:hypothetical protein